MPISILSQWKIFLINRTKSASNVPTQEINQKTKSRKEKKGKHEYRHMRFQNLYFDETHLMSLKQMRIW